ncbi:hypothetical protein CV093_12360 [Oceanobacillus sp. 143]|uniref:Putative Flagellin Flp1-like domain-containing protein n=1 Tax=Oceanobacillus zhaokaii TaxID=2052660 RepID=A0A345PHR0_9BACI|nr:Flp1 family type IVb pilin [Oceanobacillus zhaokaii]AXI09540.1 hypothetical protein CUC15_11670 [Oceanobacillus zhaokaii]QGS68927.1 hypothetical protein CV093_12360 [Oceanobacillus sp. 143]
MKNVAGKIKKFWKDESGLQTLEMMLIIAVIVVIALLFRDQIMTWINNLLSFGNDQINNFTN